MNNKKKFKKSPKGYPIDWSGKSGIYLYSEWFEYDGYQDSGILSNVYRAWIHVYRDVAGESALNSYFKAKTNSEEREFNRKLEIAS